MWLSRVALRTHCASATAIQFTLRTHVRTCALCTAQVHATASSSMTSPTPAAALFAQVKGLVPDLEADKYKGEAGKIGVIGGCREYTGAPYFAAMSALRVGADLSHVFCTNGAATVVKSYSPELIVHPYLPDASDPDHGELHPDRQHTLKEAAVEAMQAWLGRFDVLVVGPGLGRDDLVLETVADVLKEARRRGLPLIVDADGLWLVNQELGLVEGYANAVLTPNAAEFRRLAARVGVDAEAEDALEEVARRLQGPVVVRKGSVDRISDGRQTIVCKEEGSHRRAGGQGDVLSGTMAAYVAWTQRHTGISQQDLLASDGGDVLPPLMLAAYAGCLTTRQASKAAFNKHGRAMGATDVITELGRTVDAWF